MRFKGDRFKRKRFSSVRSNKLSISRLFVGYGKAVFKDIKRNIPKEEMPT